MMPFTLMLVVLLIALFMAAAMYVAVAGRDVAPSGRGFGLVIVLGFTTVGCLACLCWVFLAYDLVPRDWDSNMREARRAGAVNESTFIKGGLVLGGGYSMSTGDERNRVTFSEPRDKLLHNTIDLGPRAARQIAVVAQGRVLMSADLGNDPVDRLNFVVFEDDRIYQFNWRNVNGAYWLRR